MNIIGMRAAELAETGNYNGLTDVLFALEQEGFIDCETKFTTREARERINALCDAARRAQNKPLSARGVPGRR
jgi:hypothetical protein